MPPSEDTLALFSDHRGALVEYAARILGNRESAEDVVQDAWLRTAQATAFDGGDGSGTTTGPDRPLGYLYRIVRNRAIDLLRQRRGETGPPPDSLGTDRPTPEEAVSQRQAFAIVAEALDALPPRTRRAVILHRVEGAKLKDIADELGISVALAHGLVYDGLDLCRERLRRRGVPRLPARRGDR